MRASCYSLFKPFVEIRYQLGIVLAPNDEMWSCDMTSIADGFSIVS